MESKRVVANSHEKKKFKKRETLFRHKSFQELKQQQQTSYTISLSQVHVCSFLFCFPSPFSCATRWNCLSHARPLVGFDPLVFSFRLASLACFCLFLSITPRAAPDETTVHLALRVETRRAITVHLEQTVPHTLHHPIPIPHSTN